MYLYSTENNKLTGLMSIAGLGKKEVSEIKGSILSTGRRTIQAMGITICGQCKEILGYGKNGSALDGGLSHGSCTNGCIIH